MKSNQPFYAKDMHTSTIYENHRYFKQSRSKTEGNSQQGPLKQFVELPQPFGVNHTYQYLRKANIRHLPQMSHSNRYASISNRQSRRSNTEFIGNLRLTKDAFKTQFTYATQKRQSKQSTTFDEDFRMVRMHLNILLYDRLDQSKNTRVKLDLMKYLYGCFLKCELKLQTMSIDQFRILSEFIPAALANRINGNKRPKYYVPQAELGFRTTRTIPEMISKFLEFKENNKIEQIYKMLDYYILPSNDVLDYQLGVLMNDLNSIASKQVREHTLSSPYTNIFIFNGNTYSRVSSIFELDTELPIVAATHGDLDPGRVVKYRYKMLRKMRKQKIMSSILKQEEKGLDYLNLSQRKQDYTRIDQMLRRKQQHKSNSNGRVKYKNPLLEIKVPFIDKSKLVADQLIFQ